MRRIAIINHETHELLIEDINESDLENLYGGDEQAYIDDNFSLTDNYSWDWITATTYYSEEDKNGIDVDFIDYAENY